MFLFNWPFAKNQNLYSSNSLTQPKVLNVKEFNCALCPAPIIFRSSGNHTYTCTLSMQTQTDTETQKHTQAQWATFISQMKGGHGREEQRTRALEVLCLVSSVSAS